MGYRFNNFLIGYFFGMHMIYLMPEQYYKNFKERVVKTMEKEYNKKDPNYLVVMKEGLQGFVSFLVGENSPYQDLMDYLDKNTKDQKK